MRKGTTLDALIRSCLLVFAAMEMGASPFFTVPLL